MNTNDNVIPKLRGQFLTALDDTEVTTEILNELVNAIEQSSGVLVPHIIDGITHAVDADPVSWNPDYFSRQKGFATRNFSRERLDHLIQIRDLFRKRNEKGFAPTVSNVKTAPMKNTIADYQPTSNLKKFVDEGDLLTTRTALRLELNDRALDGADLRGALAWAKEAVRGIFEPFSEGAFARELISDQSKWTEDYFDLQVTYLKTNFSEKRFLHLIDVREQLRDSAVESFAPIASTASKANEPLSVSATLQTSGARSGLAAPRVNADRTNPAFKAALLIGGAIAAVVVFLVALVR
ncbi:hypothetical protein ACTMQT_12060 [Pseudomonas syringae pv. aptata]|uniref:hypothetical protein n=1 Tax=Pseudomonas syringae TaxID=317 RepID=UPI003F89A708